VAQAVRPGLAGSRSDKTLAPCGFDEQVGWAVPTFPSDLVIQGESVLQ